MDLQFSLVSNRDGTPTARVGGRLDTHSYLEFDRQLQPVLDDARDTLVLDLADLSYVSSAGIRSIFTARKRMTEHGGRLLIVNAQPQVRKVFDIVKAVPVKEIFASVAELDAYLDAIQRKALEEDD